mgnify:FL=1
MTKPNTGEVSESGQLPELLTVYDLSGVLKISPRSIWRLVRAGRLPAPIHLGASTRWKVAEIAAWLSQDRPVDEIPRPGMAADEGVAEQ